MLVKPILLKRKVAWKFEIAHYVEPNPIAVPFRKGAG